LFIHEFAERGLLFGTALEKQQHAVHGRRVRDDALIEFGPGERVHVAPEADELRFINRLGDAGLGEVRGDDRGLCGRRALRRGLRGRAKRRERQYQSKNEEGIAKHQRLEFHIPPMLADLNLIPTQRIRP